MKFLNSFKIIFYFSFYLFSNSVLCSENLDNKIKELTLELRCMTCQNQSVYDSDSEFANDIKIIVKEKFNEGLDEKEIKIFLTERYGEYILFKPYFNLKNLLLWVFPFLILLVSLGFFLKRLKKRPGFNYKLFIKFKKIQLPLDYKMKKSQFIIRNNFTNKSVKKDIKYILKRIL